MLKPTITVVALFLCAFSQSQDQPQPAKVNLQELADSVAGKTGTAFEKTVRLVSWINTSFQWTYTDYQNRTVEQIVERRAGNCADLAVVLQSLLQSVEIRARWIAEINIQPENLSRQANAEALVKRIGNKGSVFGLMHNDHRWLEVYDEAMQTWFPADPAVGVVGLRGWVLARLGFDSRPVSPIPAVAETTKGMIAPFVVLAMESKAGSPMEDRSAYYLVDGFNRVYGRKLEGLPSWNDWAGGVNRLSSIASSAFKGETNLHASQPLIASLARTYRNLSAEAQARNIVPLPAEK